jgi:hypothetical protein
MALSESLATRVKVWNLSATRYMALGILLLAISIISSAIVTVFTNQLSTVAVKGLSFAAAVATALHAKFNPLDIGFRFRAAWRLLDSAMLRHNAAPESFPENLVIDELVKGEAIIAASLRPSPQ